MRYRCLILDHDDTAVRSTAEIHYPSYLESMRRMRPDLEPVDMNTFLEKNFDPGIVPFLTEEVGLSREELELEYEIWRSFTTSTFPSFFPGMLELIREVRSRGGLVAVVSHSEEDIIEWHYRHAAGDELMPDFIMGWHREAEKRKPNPYPVHRILDALDVSPEEALVVDDLKPGVNMARAAGVAVAGAGWGHRVESIVSEMKSLCDVYFETVSELREYVVSGSVSGASA
ncbi:MAG: HAD hydrolase-like protein [Spirochaetia bacterium]